MRSLPKDDPNGATSTSEKRWAAAATHPDIVDLAAAQKYMENFLAFGERWRKMMEISH